jgi:hypothetical protein
VLTPADSTLPETTLSPDKSYVAINMVTQEITKHSTYKPGFVVASAQGSEEASFQGRTDKESAPAVATFPEGRVPIVLEHRSQNRRSCFQEFEIEPLTAMARPRLQVPQFTPSMTSLDYDCPPIREDDSPPLTQIERKRRFSRLGKSFRRMVSQASIDVSKESQDTALNNSDTRISGHEGKQKIPSLRLRRSKSMAPAEFSTDTSRVSVSSNRGQGTFRLLSLGRSFRTMKSQKSGGSGSEEFTVHIPHAMDVLRQREQEAYKAMRSRLGQSFRRTKSHSSSLVTMGSSEEFHPLQVDCLPTGDEDHREFERHISELRSYGRSFRTTKFQRPAYAATTELRLASPFDEEAYIPSKHGTTGERFGLIKSKSFMSSGSSMEKSPRPMSGRRASCQELLNRTQLLERHSMLSRLGRSFRGSKEQEDDATVLDDKVMAAINKAAKATLASHDQREVRRTKSFRMGSSFQMGSFRRSTKSQATLAELEKPSATKAARLEERRSALTRLGRSFRNGGNDTVAESTENGSLPSRKRASHAPCTPPTGCIKNGKPWVQGARLCHPRPLVQVPDHIYLGEVSSAVTSSLGDRSLGDTFSGADGEHGDKAIKRNVSSFRERPSDIPSAIVVDLAMSDVESLGNPFMEPGYENEPEDNTEWALIDNKEVEEETPDTTEGALNGNIEDWRITEASSTPQSAALVSFDGELDGGDKDDDDEGKFAESRFSI